MRVLAISGSLRSGSHNTRLLEAAARVLDERGVEVETLDPEVLRSLPYFDEDLEADVPEQVARLRELISGADGLLIATPEYNSSIPGVIKNAVDWASRPRPDQALANKPVVVLGASVMMFGAVWAQAELRKVLGAAGARVVDAELALGNAAEAFAGDGGLAEAGHNEMLETAAEALVTAIHRREQRTAAEEQPAAA